MNEDNPSPAGMWDAVEDSEWIKNLIKVTCTCIGYFLYITRCSER